MFCTNCGKNVIDGAKFCNHCGVPIVSSGENKEPSVVSADNTIPAEATETALTATASPAETAPAAVQAPVSEPTAVMTQPAQTPVPNTIPSSGSVPSYPSYPVDNAVKIAENPPKEKPERRFTLTHIVMCLAAAAVFAITAGVFAGLYFSAIN